MTALSRTVRLTTCSTELPKALSSGRTGLRSRVILSPNRPQHAAGMRIEPRPSLAWASGTMPAATAEAEPPDEPPEIWSGFHGLRQGPRDGDSVVPVIPNSGGLVLPRNTAPLVRYRATRPPSAASMRLRVKRLP